MLSNKFLGYLFALVQTVALCLRIKVEFLGVYLTFQSLHQGIKVSFVKDVILVERHLETF